MTRKLAAKAGRAGHLGTGEHRLAIKAPRATNPDHKSSAKTFGQVNSHNASDNLHQWSGRDVSCFET